MKRHRPPGREGEGAPTGNVDKRLIHRSMVRDLLEGFRAGQVTPEGLPTALSRLRREVGRVLVDTLFQELRGRDHKDRHLATICLQIIADDEVETKALDVLRRPSTAAHTKVGAIEILETLGYSQEDLLPQIPYVERPSIAEAMLESYILLVNDPMTLGGMLSQFLDLPPDQQETYIELFGDSGDPRVVDFLWYVSGTGAEQTSTRARDALSALHRAGVHIGSGPTRSLVSLLEEQVGTKILGEDLLEWGCRCVREGDLVMAEACLRGFLADEPEHGSAMLQLATILAGQGRTDECRRAVATLRQRLGPDHFQAQKAQELAMLLDVEEGGEAHLSLDPVESLIDCILGGLIPTTPHQYHMAILMWNQFIRFAQQPLKRVNHPLAWAAAVVYNVRRIMGLGITAPDLARRLGGLGEVIQSTILTRARRIRADLDLDAPDGVEWLEGELAARVDDGDEQAEGDDGPDWSWLSDHEIEDLADYRLWVAFYRARQSVTELLRTHPALETGPTDDSSPPRLTFDWRKRPRARPYNLGPDTKARFLLRDGRLAVITLSSADLGDAMDLLEAGTDSRVRLERVVSRPLFEIARDEMIAVARGQKSGFELEVHLDMVDLEALDGGQSE